MLSKLFVFSLRKNKLVFKVLLNASVILPEMLPN